MFAVRNVTMPRGFIVSIVVVLCCIGPWAALLKSRAEAPGWQGTSPRSAAGRAVTFTKPPAQKPAQKSARREAPPAFTDFRLPAGTVVTVKISTTVRSASSSGGDQIDATLTEAISRDGVELLPPGSVMRGTVVDAAGASRREPRGRIAVAFFVIEHVRTRSRAAIRTRPIAVDAAPSPDNRPADVELPAGQTLSVVLDKPLWVRIPK
jgi:hypothetical protein